MLGRTIGSYTIVEKLGSGGMGEVYFAEHRRIARPAAIKFLLPTLSRDADMVARFFNEARATALIKHPGIVEIYDCDVVDERAYIVMEYLEGENLASAVSRTGGFASEIASIVSVAGQIASALAAAHSKGIVHRDLKPENVFLAIEGSRAEAPFIAKILDFGIAKLASKDDGAASHTRPGSLLGTPVYMSPEQCRGLSTVDHRADIYALGCIMFELVTGRHVFLKDAPGDLLVAHISETAPTVSSITPGVPVAFDQLVARMLAKSPDARPASMDLVVSELEAMLGAKVAEFPKMLPPTSRMPLPYLPKRRGTVTSMPAVLRTTPMLPDGESREADARGPTVQVGGTKVLSKESTFRQTASELLPPGERRGRRIPLVLALIAGGGAVAALALFLRPAPVVVRPVAVDKPVACTRPGVLAADRTRSAGGGPGAAYRGAETGRF